MFCSKCGEKLIATDQKFCHNCGTEVLTPSKAIDYNTERIQNITAPKIDYAPSEQRKQLQRGNPGRYSKLCLCLASVSIGIGILSLIIGYTYYGFSYRPYNNIGRLVFVIVILLLRVGGLIMSVFSKTYSSKAEKLEPYNDLEKVGSILGIFGIVINSLGLFLSFFSPWSILYFIRQY